MSKTWQVGAWHAAGRTFSESDVKRFASVSGDKNPVHLDAEYAATTPFGQRIVHGMLVASMFSELLANELPGPGTIYLGQELSFKKPVFLDEWVHARVEVIEGGKPEKGIYKLKTTVVKTQSNEVAVEGVATVLNKGV